MSQIIAHLILRNALLNAKLCNSVSDKFLVHDNHLIYNDTSYQSGYTPRIYVVSLEKSPIIYVIIECGVTNVSGNKNTVNFTLTLSKRGVSMRIAICDDMQLFLDELHEMILKY